MSIAHIFLWATAAIWGFAFVAQSVGMESLGPHSFNAMRFLLATLSLLPLLFIFKPKQSQDNSKLWLGGLAAGNCLFLGFTCQQIGLQYTTAGNAGFITSMYIVFVPILGLILGHKTERHTWIGVGLALIGLYSLTVGPNLSINKGDAIELLGTLFLDRTCVADWLFISICIRVATFYRSVLRSNNISLYHRFRIRNTNA